jgi:hypothetical protein
MILNKNFSVTDKETGRIFNLPNVGTLLIEKDDNDKEMKYIIHEIVMYENDDIYFHCHLLDQDEEYTFSIFDIIEGDVIATYDYYPIDVINSMSISDDLRRYGYTIIK